MGSEAVLRAFDNDRDRPYLDQPWLWKKPVRTASEIKAVRMAKLSIRIFSAKELTLEDIESIEAYVATLIDKRKRKAA